MKNLRLLTAIVILMVLINIALLLMLWMGRPAKKGPSAGSARDFLVKELSLTATQTEQYDSLRKGHHEAIVNLQQEMRKGKEDFFAMLSRPVADSASIEAAAAKNAAIMELQDKLTYYHFRQVRGILSPGQQQRFDQVIQKALRMMQQPPPPAGEGRSGPPGGGHEGPPPSTP